MKKPKHFPTVAAVWAAIDAETKGTKMKKITLEEKLILEIEEFSKLHSVCGGTTSSQQLRFALAVREQCHSSFNSRVDVVIERWRSALQRHNEQPLKLVEYDVKTGLVKKRKGRK